MRSDADRHTLLYKIAKAYYEDGLTQHQIGRRFSLSRVKVSRLLQEARDERVVQIAIVSSIDSNADLERELEARFDLLEAVVVTPADYSAPVILQELGTAAANHLMRCLQGKEIVALSWGTTLHAVIEALPAQNWPDLKVVQILGGVGDPEVEVHGNDLSRRMAQSFGAQLRFMPSPGIVGSRQVRDALIGDPQIASSLALGQRADVALVGIGVPIPGSVVDRAGILSKDEIVELANLAAVGDIALRFFDKNGQPTQHAINDRIVGLDIDQMRRIPRRIGVAGGSDKHQAIGAVLRGGLVNVIVTDERSARYLLTSSGKAPDSANGIAAQATIGNTVRSPGELVHG
ncbi:MAG: sugar-binding transcriptional regulator [Chloroflexota bacterium]|nr:sugar-binding transcriptional regulator [Chloroflexota bacterium]